VLPSVFATLLACLVLLSLARRLIATGGRLRGCRQQGGEGQS